MPDYAPLPDAETAQLQAIRDVAAAIGELMRFWNFTPSMGRIWATLYLSQQPLSAEDLERIAELSSGNVSMSLTELIQRGVVLRVPGGRRRLYAAETDIWKMVTRVFRERELRVVDRAIAELEAALALVQSQGASSQVAFMVRGRFLITRIERLLNLAKLGRRLIERLANTGQADISALRTGWTLRGP